MKNRISLLMILLAIAMYGYAGEMISGVVLDQQSEPIIGAAVKIVGTTQGTVTDFDGNFTLDVEPNQTLEVSYLGYVPQVITVAQLSKNGGKVLLKEDTQALDEVVVVGYGTQKKSVVTAAISKVSAEDLENVIPTRVDNLLKGKASGVTITSSSGQPGAGTRINIRGIGTINDASPLYVVDGMPVGNIDYLNPTDIESIEVLKDAASAAIYGTKGANGVILVTTKNGEFGKKVSVSYDMNIGWQNPWKQKAVLTAPWYQTILNEARLNDGSAPYFSTITSDLGTNWQDALFNYNAPVQSHQVSVNGGSDKVTYFVSFGYLDQEGIVGGNFDRSNYTRYTVRNNNVYKIIDTEERKWLNHFTITSNISYSNVKSTGIAENSAFYSPLGSALLIAPTQPIYATEAETPALLEKYPTAVKDKEGRLYSIPDITMAEIINPIANLELPAGWNYSDRFTGNFTAELEIYDGLKFKSSFNADYNFGRYDGYGYPYYLSSGGAGSSTTSSVSSTHSRTFTWQVENTLFYNKSFDSGHELGVLLGQSATKTAYSYVSGTAYDLPSNDPYKATIDYAQGSAEDQRTSGGRSYSAGASYFARVNYNYKERYIFQASLRCDGSDKFGKNNRWGLFGAVGFMWNLRNEDFMLDCREWMNQAQISFSTGTSGNSEIPNYEHLALISGGADYIGDSGVAPVQPGNENLTWENTWTSNLGFHFGFWNRLNVDFELYCKRTTDMLMEVPKSYAESNGYGYVWDNVGAMLNMGAELNLTATVITYKDFNWTVNANAGYNHNRIVELYNGVNEYETANTSTKLVVGHPLGEFYINRYAGVNPANGDALWYDKDGNITNELRDEDRVLVGKSYHAPWQGGFGTAFSWKGLSLSAQFGWVADRWMLNNDRYFDESNGRFATYNQSRRLLDRWKQPGDITDIPRHGIFTEFDSRLLEDASFLRLKNLNLSYSLPSDLLKKTGFIRGLRLYVQGQNLLTFTNFSGLDPEGTRNIYAAQYPMSRQYTFGLDLLF